MKRKLLLFCSLFVLIAGVVGTIYVSHRPVENVQASGGTGDWTMFQGDLARTGTNLGETLITPATAASLHYSWSFPTGGYVVASPTIVSGVMYIGSWDGFEYAIDVSTHQQLWRQSLGVTIQNKYCYSLSVGVTSTAAVDNGVLYVGGGDGYMYALNTVDGSVKWKTLLGLPPYYNFSSPVVYNNLVYTGLSAFCDPPYVQGKVVALNVNDGSLAASVSFVPDKQTGAPVWSSVAIDAATNTVFATTGNPGSGTFTSQPLSNAIVAMDATTLAVKDHWQIPVADEVSDSDFGATPVLFDLNGVSYIGALNKNGVFYVLNRNNLSAGFIWRQVVSGNSQLVQGDNVSASCYNNGVLYVGSAGGSTYGGTVHAFDAATGQQLWGFNTAGQMVSSITCTNGLVVDEQGNVVEVRDASNGNILFHHATTRRLEGTSVISNGALYTPSTDKLIYVFTLKGTSTPTPTATTSPSPGQPIFQDNFDSYAPGSLPTGTGTNQWTSVNVTGTGFGANVSNAQANSAPNSLQFAMGSGIKGHAFVSKRYNSGFTSHAGEFHLLLDPGLTFDTQAITLFTARNHSNTTNGSTSVWLSVNRHLQVIWYDSTGKKHVFSTSSILSPGQWYKIELDQTNDPANGSWSLWLNGTQIAAQTVIDTGNTQVDTCIAGDTLASVTAMSGMFYEDDVVTANQHIG